MMDKEKKLVADIVGKPRIQEEDDKCVPLKPIQNPRVEGGNIVVIVDGEDYNRGVEELQFSIIGRFSLQRNEEMPNTMEIKKKLSNLWRMGDFKVIALGKGLFHIQLHNLQDQTKALTGGAVYLKPGVL